MEEKKPKRKYTRRQPKVQPLAVYNVLVTVKRGKKVETIYAESTRVESGCLVVVSMDGPPPLVEKVRYIPFGDGEITVCQRQQQAMRWVQPASGLWQNTGPMGASNQAAFVPAFTNEGPRVISGPLGLASRGPEAPRAPRDIVERNADGVPVVTAGFLDGSPT